MSLRYCRVRGKTFLYRFTKVSQKLPHVAIKSAGMHVDLIRGDGMRRVHNQSLFNRENAGNAELKNLDNDSVADTVCGGFDEPGIFLSCLVLELVWWRFIVQTALKIFNCECESGGRDGSVCFRCRLRCRCGLVLKYRGIGWLWVVWGSDGRCRL
jgi:hypothetical protein